MLDDGLWRNRRAAQAQHGERLPPMRANYAGEVYAQDVGVERVVLITQIRLKLNDGTQALIANSDKFFSYRVKKFF